MGDVISTMLGNKWTTILGPLTGVLLYLQQVGAHVPETKNDWFAFIIGVACAAFGITAKDATTGSKPQ